MSKNLTDIVEIIEITAISLNRFEGLRTEMVRSNLLSSIPNYLQDVGVGDNGGLGTKLGEMIGSEFFAKLDDGISSN